MIIRPRVSQSLQRQLSLVSNIFIRANASKCTPFISTISFIDSVPLLQVDGSKVDLDIRSSRSTTSLGLWTDLTHASCWRIDFDNWPGLFIWTFCFFVYEFFKSASRQEKSNRSFFSALVCLTQFGILQTLCSWREEFL